MYLLLTVYSMRRHTSKMHYKEDDLVGEQIQTLQTRICFQLVSLKRLILSPLLFCALNPGFCLAGETHFIH